MNVEDEDITPLHQGTKATIRAILAVGHRQPLRNAQPRPQRQRGGRGGRNDRRADDTAAPVDLDQLFNTLDAKTRRGLQRVIEGQGTYFGGRSKEYEQALKYLAPTFSTTSRLTKELTLDSELFNRFLVDTSRAVGAISERSTELEQLVGNAGATAEAIGSENAALRPGARRAARHAAQGQHDAREPARRPRRPGPAGGGVQARDQGPRRLLPPAAPAGGGRRAHDPGPAPADPPEGAQQRPDRLPARHAAPRGGCTRVTIPRHRDRALAVAARCELAARSTRPTLPAGSRSSAPARPTTTPTATSRACSPLQPVQLQRLHRHPHQAAGQQLRRVRGAAAQALSGRGNAAPARRLRALRGPTARAGHRAETRPTATSSSPQGS